MVPEHYRSTHHRDPVPHLPFDWMGYTHIVTEIYYDSNSTDPKICSSTDGEDPTCADQFDMNLLYITDHWYYLGFSFYTDIIRCTV